MSTAHIPVTLYFCGSSPLSVLSSFKVRGYCKDKSNPEIFDSVGVYGNIYDSEIHHNYFGVYTYGKTRRTGEYSCRCCRLADLV